MTLYTRFFAALYMTTLISASAANLDEASLSITPQGFQPQPLKLSGQHKTRLHLRNHTASAAEFESADLSREIIVPAHSEVILYLPPLHPGIYRYFNDFHTSESGQIRVP